MAQNLFPDMSLWQMPPLPSAPEVDIRTMGGGGNTYPASEIPDPPTAEGMDASKAYQYAILASLLGSMGAGLGQAFRPWGKPPQPMPSQNVPQMPITAPAALQALTQTRATRKGF